MRPESKITPMETKALTVNIVAYTDGIYTIRTERPNRDADTIYTLETQRGEQRTRYELYDTNTRPVAAISFENIEVVQRPSYAIGWALTCVLTKENGLRLPPPRSQS